VGELSADWAVCRSDGKEMMVAALAFRGWFSFDGSGLAALITSVAALVTAMAALRRSGHSTSRKSDGGSRRGSDDGGD
jgi:hypothetical protein